MSRDKWEVLSRLSGDKLNTCLSHYRFPLRGHPLVMFIQSSCQLWGFNVLLFKIFLLQKPFKNKEGSKSEGERWLVEIRKVTDFKTRIVSALIWMGIYLHLYLRKISQLKGWCFPSFYKNGMQMPVTNRITDPPIVIYFSDIPRRKLLCYFTKRGYLIRWIDDIYIYQN